MLKQKPGQPTIEKMMTIQSETDRLRADIFRSDKEKLQLFTKMIRNNAIYSRAKITHK